MNSFMKLFVLPMLAGFLLFEVLPYFIRSTSATSALTFIVIGVCALTVLAVGFTVRGSSFASRRVTRR